MLPAQARVTMQIRELILTGHFAPGEHLTETRLADELDVSRTPVRIALGILEQEGLVKGAPNKGFSVRAFSLTEISGAITVRGALEGLAAQLVAEMGLTRAAQRELRGLLDFGDRLTDRPNFSNSDVAEFAEMNGRFHAVIVENANNPALVEAIGETNKFPFVPPATLAFSDPKYAHRLIIEAHGHHHKIVEALEEGQGSRADALMREHALFSKTPLNAVTNTKQVGWDKDPAIRLIQK